MAASEVRAAYRQDLFIHQEVVRKLRGRRIVKIDSQIDPGTLQIDVVVAGQDGQ